MGLNHCFRQSSFLATSYVIVKVQNGRKFIKVLAKGYNKTEQPFGILIPNVCKALLLSMLIKATKLHG